MTDKQLNSLTKQQMINIIHQQEKEIERLASGSDEPQVKSETELLSEIILAAQEAADSYLKGIKDSEVKRVEGIAELEKNTQRSYEEAERFRTNTIVLARSVLTDFNRAFEWLIGSIESMQNEFEKRLGATSIKNFLPIERRDDR